MMKRSSSTALRPSLAKLTGAGQLAQSFVSSSERDTNTICRLPAVERSRGGAVSLEKARGDMRSPRAGWHLRLFFHALAGCRLGAATSLCLRQCLHLGGSLTRDARVEILARGESSETAGNDVKTAAEPALKSSSLRHS